MTSSTDFERVRLYGKSYAHPFIVLITHPNKMDNSRFATAAGRTIGKAVQRNRAKRILRETLRPFIPNIISGWDVVLLARKPLMDATHSDIESALKNLLSQANLLENTS